MMQAPSNIEEGAAVRKAGPADRDGIWTVFLTSVLELCNTHYDREEVLAWARSIEPEMFERTLAAKETLVVEEDFRIVAFGQFDPKESVVEALYVAPGSTGKGLGRRVLRIFEESAKSHGSGWIQMSSTLNAVGFFEKEGYKQARMEQMHLPDGVCLPRIRMSKSFPEKG